MLYYLLRLLFRITNKVFFRSLQIKGSENIPNKGPVLFVANHPSAFMDPIVIATVVKRPLYFLAKGAVFQNKFSSWLLSKFNAIPIYRSHETPGQGHKNKDVFIKCYKHLAQGGALLIFPEGLSLTERKIKKIQSGAARICLGAAAANDFSLDIKIVTIGLNFSDPHSFQSDLFVSIDKPISVSEYIELYKKDSFKAVHELTDEIRKRIESQVVAIEDAEVDKLVANIELIYKAQLLKDLGHSEKLLEHDFNVTKGISDSVHYFKEFQPERVENMKAEIGSYLNDLDRLSIKDNLIGTAGTSMPLVDAMKTVLYLMLGSPLFIFGIINNYIPFKIPNWSSKLINKRPEFFGSISISVGTLSFIVFYTFQIWLVLKYIDNWIIQVSYIILMPISGLFAFYYSKRLKRVLGNWKVFTLFYKKRDLISSLILKRQHIIIELEKGRKEFMDRNNELKK